MVVGAWSTAPAAGVVSVGVVAGPAVASGEEANTARFSIVGVAMAVLRASESLDISVPSLLFKSLSISPTIPPKWPIPHSDSPRRRLCGLALVVMIQEANMPAVMRVSFIRRMEEKEKAQPGSWYILTRTKERERK